MAQFNIATYVKSLIGYPIPQITIQRIVRERGLEGMDDWIMITRRDRNLVIADCLMYLFTSPSNTGSKTKQHGNFSITVGGTIITDKNDIYALMMRLYQNPDAELYEALATTNLGGGCQWME